MQGYQQRNWTLSRFRYVTTYHSCNVSHTVSLIIDPSHTDELVDRSNASARSARKRPIWNASVDNEEEIFI